VAIEENAGAPFDFVGNGDVGVVCVHGFTGTPFEVRYLGEQLARGGFQVHGLRLPGHGTQLTDLDGTTWHDWADAVEKAFDTMRLSCRKVVVVGQSLGGLLGLHLAARCPDVAAVASLAAPLWLDGLGGQVAALAANGTLARVMPWFTKVPKFSGSDVRDKKARAANPCYDAIPLKALGELVRYMQVVDASLDQITQPVLVLHATQDHTAPVACAYRIAERARAQRVRILPQSYHLIAADVERDIVADEVISFVRRTTRETTEGDHACVT
jgi:carboxylesterase